MRDPFIDGDEKWLVPDRPTPSTLQDAELWVVHITHNAVGASRARAEGFVCFGCVEVGNLKQYSTPYAMRSVIDRLYSAHPETKRARWAEDAMRFVYQVEEGQLVVYPIHDQPDLMVGQFVGDYEFAGQDGELVQNDCASIRRVLWLATLPRSSFSEAAQRSFSVPFTIHSLAGYRGEVLAVLAANGVVLPGTPNAH
jgi:predicted Mrr-cat superfamily restriction endonuclease